MLTLLENADLYDPVARGRAHVVVAGSRIVEISTDPIDPGLSLLVDRVDLAGRRLVPGLVDGHVHLTGGGGEGGPLSSLPALEPADFTRAGVTSVVGLLGTDDTVRTTGSLVARTRALRHAGLSAWCLTGGYHLPPQTLTGSVRSDIVNIEQIIGVGELAISDHRSSQPTLDELLRVAADAHTGGLLADKAGIVHLHVGDGDRGLSLVRDALATSELPPRVFHPTHVNRHPGLWEEAMKLAAEHLPIDVTAFPVEQDDPAVPAATAIAQWLDAGLPGHQLTVSSDAGGSLPLFDAHGRLTGQGVGAPSMLVDVLAQLLDDGRELGDVLRLFTSNPARQFRLSRGSIDQGGVADLMVLDEDHRPRDVMARGRWHLRDGLLATYDPTKPRHQAIR